MILAKPYHKNHKVLLVVTHQVKAFLSACISLGSLNCDNQSTYSRTLSLASQKGTGSKH